MGWTVRTMIETGHILSAACHARGCHHFARIDLEALRDTIGPDASTMAPDLVPRLRCSRCGGRDIGLIIHPPERRVE